MSMDNVVRTLNEAKHQAEKELSGINKALEALNGHGQKKPMATERRVMSAAGRRRIAAAQKARWAKIRQNRLVLIRKTGKKAA